MTRGIVLPLTADDRRQRMLYLSGDAPLKALDRFARKDPAELERLTGYESNSVDDRCPEIFYLLHEHNGGKDPAAPDPADRWVKDGGTFTNRTCDCIGGMAWAGGWDRYQQERLGLPGWDGWINTDSMIEEARGPARCFIETDRPELGSYIVIASGSPGYAVGHIRGIVGVPAEWDPKAPECWGGIEIVEVAAFNGRANRRSHLTAGVAHARPVFVRPIMTP